MAKVVREKSHRVIKDKMSETIMAFSFALNDKFFRGVKS